MARVEKTAEEIEVGDRIYFPNSRASQVVGQVFTENETVHIISEGENAKWMMVPSHVVACEAEEESTDAEG